ncbi:class A sortase [Lysinibacillus fusiformis]|uniref:class A sortase n=1 Tax=Lysinibacillus TaxID=400634 RepID=UPI0004D58ACC|nr:MULTISPECIES: class A sortase [Lysinibacillus]KAB0441289.1 class A sortase [Lysinibacillus fusiformis]KEK11931.1 sortase [Lysinibacillus sphaericus]MDC6270361.1 class A sortase [Lysinibacillus sphaericus]MDN4971586.1 class A sortase [Lysinibacillus fusiformis]QEA00779.1 class A sortase [Lysinibacillus fusiformis]
MKRNKLKLALLLCALIIGLLLIFITPIQNALIARMSDQFNAVEYSTDDIKKNNQLDANFEFEAVQSLSIAEVLQAQINASKMPVIGSIAVPSVHMQLPILKGVGNAVLAIGAGTMKPNQQLGQGNYALAGHYFEEKDILFSPLYQAQIGDIIYVTDMSNVYEYKLATKKIIAATDVYIVDDIPNQTTLTLITCAEKGSKRLALQADFVQSYSLENAKGTF